MLNFLTALVTWMQTTVEFDPFLGSYIVDDYSQGIGPFFDIAPEEVSLPYVVYNVFNSDMDQGFFTATTKVVEKPWIRFHLYDTNADTLAQNLEVLQGKLDTLMSLSLSGGETCGRPIRTENATVLQDSIFEDGQRIYHGFVTYQFRVAKAL